MTNGGDHDQFNGHYAFTASMATTGLVEVVDVVVVLRLLHASTKA